MADVLSFGEVLEAAEHLSEGEQEMLREVLHKRAAERRRDEIAMDVQEARREHEEKTTRPATPDELMGEILS